MPHVHLLTVPFLLAMGSFPAASPALPVRADSTSLAVDSARVAVRPLSDTLLARFRNDPAFNYDRASGWVWWRDLRRWMNDQLARLLGLFGADGAGEWPRRILFYLGVALLVGYGAYVLVQLRSDARAPAQTAPDAITHPQTAEEMRAIDYENRLQDAVDREHYRRGVRLLYQWTLQRLDRTEAISWHPGKTNRAYLHELDADASPTFATLTRLFEHVWYGGAAVDAQHFKQVRRRFESFWEQVPAATADVAHAEDAPPVVGCRRAHDDSEHTPSSSA